MTKLLQDQIEFGRMVGQLLSYIYDSGYGVTLGDAYRDPTSPAYKQGTFHAKRLAIDLNLFRDGVYLTGTESHKLFGDYWKSIGGTWGGDFKKPDGNHYSYME